MENPGKQMQHGALSEPRHGTHRGTVRVGLAFSVGVYYRNYRRMGNMPENPASKRKIGVKREEKKPMKQYKITQTELQEFEDKLGNCFLY